MIMTGLYQKTTGLVILMGLLLLLSTGEAQSNRDCCLSYTKKPLPKRIIRGYMEQLSSEVCDINAVIFYTKNGFRACANPKDMWVQKHLRWLSKKLKKISDTRHF
ncbi:C-C motif chemokine 20 [Pogona vitticeps]|uniref:C-C motif chemokine n=1 Tax=Pogona vitticeps TaxID=103695 RepID=A0ABM5G381_9SAUR